MLNLELNWLTFAIALSAFVYSVILTEKGHILHKLSWYLEQKLPEHLYKPLIGCQFCVSGQWALWFYFYITLVQNQSQYVWWLHLWFIMQTIFLVEIITYFYFMILKKDEVEKRKAEEERKQKMKEELLQAKNRTEEKPLKLNMKKND